TMYDAGWAAPGWPREWGGREATVSQRVIVQEEIALARAAVIINAIGVWNIGPTLLEFGTEDQKRRWLPAMLSAQEIWCQGFSEPGAGSDLASLQTKATRGGDDYRVSGQKVWISYGHRADRCFLLCRTGDTGHRGMCVLVLNMHAAGVETRPIREMTGDAAFVELFLDDVRVPVADRVGEEGDGWRIAMSTLTHERVGTVTYGIQLRQKLESLLRKQEAWPTGEVEGRLARQDLAALWTEIEIIRLTALRAVTKAARGEVPWPEVPIGKLLWSMSAQHLSETAVHLFGADGLRTRGDDRAPDEGRWAWDLAQTRMTTIGAGTTEIQKNTLAERALGLPRS
ncbi:MAG: acyl-CoA dehydrogenase family protein, partial [Actinobacteria bacterium]|nr:acyl-CoA dehydrogenase family protein [Actinomycetota bacterium]